MRVLLVDDDEKWLQGAVPRFEKIVGAPSNLTLAKSRSSAIAALDAGFYDAFILDLKIPTTDGGGDGHVEHGRAVFLHTHGRAPRTPVYILTGEIVDPIVDDLLRHAEQIDVWGDRRPMRTVQVRRKMNLTELLDELPSIVQCVADTDGIEVNTAGLDLGLSPQQRRVVRIFARRRESFSCTVATLTGGLSGSRVFRVTACGAGGHIQIVAAGKIADIDTVDDEVRRYEQYVKLLQPGAFPQKVEVVRAGAGLDAGVFYWLLKGDAQPLFSFLADHPARAETAVAGVQHLTKPWDAAAPQTQKQIAEIRRRLVGDEEAAELVTRYGLPWAGEFEARHIQTKWSCLHGDLHGGNVLVDGSATPILIDFGDVGPGAASIDPITMELSLLFHPGAQEIREAWPPTDTAALWADCSRYTQNCPCPEFIQACRKWSHSVAAGDREVYASAYAYLLRQLKYPGTDKKLALVLLEAVHRSFQATF